MDGQRFDELIRTLTESPSRRSLLGGLTGGFLGGVLSRFGLDDAEAARKKKKPKKGKKPKRPKKCPPGRKRCGKVCCRKTQVCKNRKCRPNPKPSNPGCTPETRAEACVGRDCGTVPDGCGGTHDCGPCSGTCNANGQCVGTCTGCEDGCCDGETCEAGTSRQACGHSGGICQSCNPEVECISGECTCTRNSCATGCCTIVDGKPFCDNTKRPCGETCIDYEECCHGRDYSYESVNDLPDCWGPETCTGTNSQGAGQCLCGGTICDSWGSSPGCCSLGNDGQPFCDYTKRRCGDVCLDNALCCHDGQETCNDGVSCTAETCNASSGRGRCDEVSVSGVCPEACAAGKGFGHYFPENERAVVCGRATGPGGNKCYCWQTVEGSNACVEDFSGDSPCRTSDDCATNEVCTKYTNQFVGAGVQYTCAPICQ